MFNEEITVCPSCLSPLKSRESICRACGYNIKNTAKSSAYNKSESTTYKANATQSYKNNSYTNNNINNNSYKQNSQMHGTLQNSKQNIYSENAFNNSYNTKATKTGKAKNKSFFIIIIVVFGFLFFSDFDFDYFIYSVSSFFSEPYHANFELKGDYGTSDFVPDEITLQDIEAHYSNAPVITIDKPSWYDENAQLEKVYYDDDYPERFYYTNEENTFIQISEYPNASVFLNVSGVDDNAYYSIEMHDNAYIVVYVDTQDYNLDIDYYDYLIGDSAQSYIHYLLTDEYYSEDVFTLQEAIYYDNGIQGFAFTQEDNYGVTYKIVLPIGVDEDGDVLNIEIDISMSEYIDSTKYYDLGQALQFFMANIYIKPNDI